MDTGQLAWQIDVELRAHGTAERAENEKAYLKSELEHYGATMPAIVSVVKSFKPRYLELDHDELLALVRALWSVPVHEARMAAVEILEQNVTRLHPDDISDLERLLRESRTWALVDPLAASIVGPLLEANPGLNAELDRW